MAADDDDHAAADDAQRAAALLRLPLAAARAWRKARRRGSNDGIVPWIRPRWDLGGFGERRARD